MMWERIDKPLSEYPKGTMVKKSCENTTWTKISDDDWFKSEGSIFQELKHCNLYMLPSPRPLTMAEKGLMKHLFLEVRAMSLQHGIDGMENCSDLNQPVQELLDTLEEMIEEKRRLLDVEKNR